MSLLGMTCILFCSRALGHTPYKTLVGPLDKRTCTNYKRPKVSK